MADEDDHDIHLPHDKLFSVTFGEPANAAAFLRTQLPAEIAAAIAWEQLTRQPGTFVDSQFRASQTDLLFSAPIGGSEGRVYLLFEHQSTPDAALPLRLLRYLTRIWENIAKDAAPGAPLPVILPVVLSQNAETWHVATRLSQLLDLPAPLAAALRPFIPDFGYRHVQLADMPFETMPGTPAGILVLRVMKAERLGQLLHDLVWDGDLLGKTPTELFHMVLRYMLAADIDMPGFELKITSIPDETQRQSAMTLAERYRSKGRLEGRVEGRVEGRNEALHESVLAVLEVRFDRVPDGLREAVLAIDDETKLSALHRAAVRTRSLEEFSQHL